MEIKNRNRLSLHNEELQWKLKQNSEKYTTALMELSRTYKDHSSFLNECKDSLYGPTIETSNDDSISSDRTEIFATLNDSPPTSPVVKGVVEKSDSVSYVLELNDDETPEELASRVVKRAGSFRSSSNEKSPSFKRQYSLGPNALAQSASATSVLRQHSETTKQKSPRNRSKSLSVHAEDSGTTSNGRSATRDYIKWKEPPLMASSPFPRHKRDSLKSNVAEEGETLRADIVPNIVGEQNGQRNDGLITCDTSALSSPRTELCPSLHRTRKHFNKCHRIKELAGEAMISSIHSDDEASFESGSDVDHVSPLSSNNTSPSHSDANKCDRNLPIEDDVLMMNKIVASLNGTPMEVSWSEDGDNDNHPHESSA